MVKKQKNPKICIIGLGYIGLPTAAVLTSAGYKVLGVDINDTVVHNLKEGNIHIKEKGLDELISNSVLNRSLSLSTTPKDADIFIICVPTPLLDNNGNIPKPDLSCVLEAIEAISPFVKYGNLIILESTSPVGTSDLVAKKLSENTKIPIKDLNIAYCPERVLPGNILFELIHNDRVIGGINSRSSDLARLFYSSFCKGELFITTSKTAEMVKLTENSFRDVNIAFANQLSLICDEIGINTLELIELSNHHPRVNILQPGCGVGGHCIAVDPWFIASSFPDKSSLIKTAREVNIYKETWVINKIFQYIRELETELNKKIKIGCYGLTFKPDVDDIRESPALNIALELIASEEVLVCDPNIKKHSQINLVSLEKVFNSVDLHVLLVSHSEFKDLIFENKKVLDFCGLLN